MKKLVTLSVAACMAVMLFAGCGKDAASSASAASEAGVSAAAAETTEAAAPEVSEAPAEEALDQAVLGTWKLSEVAYDGDPRMTLDEYAEKRGWREDEYEYTLRKGARYTFAEDGTLYYASLSSDHELCTTTFRWELHGDTVYLLDDMYGSTIDDAVATVTIDQGKLMISEGSDTSWLEKDSDSQTPPESLE